MLVAAKLPTKGRGRLGGEQGGLWYKQTSQGLKATLNLFTVEPPEPENLS